MKENILKVITEKYNSFSKTNKIIADYILDNYLTVPFLTIKELSEKAKVSPASITRFAKGLGLDGYPMFQNKLQEIVKNQITPMKEIRESITSVKTDKKILENIFSANIKSLKTSLTENLSNAFDETVSMMLDSRHIYILGLRSSYCVAYYLYFMLKQFLDNVLLLNTTAWDIYDYLAHADQRDILIAVSFSRYTALTEEVAKYCKKNQIKVAAITDSFASPIALNSDIQLIARNDSNAYSFAAAMSICNALVVACGSKNETESIAKMRQKEKILIENKVYR